MRKREPRFICSFCGDDERTAAMMFAGHTANICAECLYGALMTLAGDDSAPESSAMMYQAGHMPRGGA